MKRCPKCGKELRYVLACEVVNGKEICQEWSVEGEFDVYDLRELGPNGEFVPFRPRRPEARAVKFYCAECEAWLATVKCR